MTTAQAQQPSQQKNSVILYTDGACKGNPGVGGWGVFLQYGEHEKSLYGGEAQTTNNRMELTAAIQGLRALTRPCHVNLFIDSQYVMKGITEWMPGWKKKNWKTANNKEVKNVDLWKLLDEEVSRHHITWHWVKGHAGNAGNERADELANRGVSSVQP